MLYGDMKVGSSECLFVLGRRDDECKQAEQRGFQELCYRSYHIGASGLAFGMLFFVFTIGIFRRERRTIALSLVVIFLYGGMISGILPGAHDISFESHLSGALIGIVLAFLLRHHDPEQPRKQYSWEREKTEVDDFDWPDQP